MVDITHKSTTHRIATAQALVKVSNRATIEAVINKQVAKGDVLEMSKTAGLFAAKKTSDIIPDCHPLPIESTTIKFELGEMEIKIVVEIQTIYKTGVEVEAMHAASVVALTIYDMLKPIDKGISIEQIKLLDKKGGKSDFVKKEILGLTAAVIVCSDSIAKGTKEDKAGKAIIKKLEECQVKIVAYYIIPDEKVDIIKHAIQYADEGVNMVIFTGGTGLSPRDNTPEALAEVIEKRIQGVEEAIRNYGQDRTPYSMLSRSVAGLRKDTLILALPGSTKGAAESMEAIFPQILHIFRVMEGARHD
jgi:cyclic pyranopterin phosphate synthase